VSHAVNPESVSRFRDCLPVPPHVALPAEQKAAAIAVQQYPVGVSRSDSSSPPAQLEASYPCVRALGDV
jgi:hypothetical protein